MGSGSGVTRIPGPPVKLNNKVYQTPAIQNYYSDLAAIDTQQSAFANSMARHPGAFIQSAPQETMIQLQIAAHSMANAYQAPEPIETRTRTQAEIEAALEERLAKLKVEAVERAAKAERPCKKCRSGRGDRCHNALVKGFDDPPLTFDRYEPYSRDNKIYLCGPEKALWEPRRNIWVCFWDWFLAPWIEERQALDIPRAHDKPNR